ncbi:hypothetical protein [Chryseobacterium indologenes]|uniref:hypothetical protein n=1 Tax=Chryseobacterium indologenes TaxID=253 RepID=UPI00102FF480|nr:hypothetical protein [Chryseobacterium indologenes]
MAKAITVPGIAILRPSIFNIKIISLSLIFLKNVMIAGIKKIFETINRADKFISPSKGEDPFFMT